MIKGNKKHCYNVNIWFNSELIWIVICLLIELKLTFFFFFLVCVVEKTIEVEAEKLCTTIGDLDGKCSQDGEKLCMRYMTDQSKKKFLSCTCNNVVMLHKYKHYCECQSHCTPKQT